MAATADLAQLKQHRRIARYCILALFASSIVLGQLGFQDAVAVAVLLLISSPLYLLYIGSRIRRAEGGQAKPAANEEMKLRLYWQMLVIHFPLAGFVLLICSSHVMLANIAALVVISVLLAMFFSLEKHTGLRRQRWAKFLIYAIAVSIGWAIDHQRSEAEQRNVDSIVVAVEQYKAAEKHYPDTLERLVPKYLSEVPVGRWGKFMYFRNNPGTAHLIYMVMPPVKKTYDFESKTSKTWD